MNNYNKNIIVTDLFGHHIDNNETNTNIINTFLLVHLKYPLEFLIRLDNQVSNIDDLYKNLNSDIITKYSLYKYNKMSNLLANKILSNRIYYDDNDSIWRIDMNKLNNSVKNELGIDLSQYSTFGDLWFPVKIINNSITIIIGNTQSLILGKPTSYVYVSQYKNGSLWKPIDNVNKKTAISLFFSLDKNVNDTPLLVASHHVIPYNGNYNKLNNITTFNEFNHVSTTDIMKLTIDRTKFNDLTNKKIGMKDNSTINKNNNILNNAITTFATYSVQGELKINGECVGVPIDFTRKYGNVQINECDNEIGQKWYIYDNHIVSQFDKTCLANVDNELKRRHCNLTDNSQIWNINNDDKINNNDNKTNNNNNINVDINKEKYNISNDKYANTKGKRVMLIESDDPWYLHFDDDVQYDHKNKNKDIELITKDIHELNDYTMYHPYRSESNISVDNNDNNFGLGYSYSDRKNSYCVNQSGGKHKKKFVKKIIFINILIVILLCVLFIMCAKNKHFL